MRDLANNIAVRTALTPGIATATKDGPVIDLQGFDSAAVIIGTGGIAGDGDFTATLEESDDGEDFSAVAADQLDSNTPETLAADSMTSIGYRGYRRFLRLHLAKNSGTSIAVAAILILGSASTRPVH
ncbi:hypothetical protein FF124_10730 [Martelella lutilitoris]|uniref:Discoidin domain-containing protein n=1 Tax=Martelella lutilitoris TaxID=2583532 RepID=A0A5C4JRZ7_9HYPH|nr:hypothetical protein [Martelella lutilitoris]TNB48047.1 hypothetical protein FF124_10730 [Martelella lutilitoris]